MNIKPNLPYADLDPNTILDAIESVDLPCNGSLLALNSYENRVYQVGIDDGTPVIAKFYRPQRWTPAAILEEHQFAAELMTLEIPVVAPLIFNNQSLHKHKGFYFALFPRHGGHALELDNVAQLEWIGRFIGRLHAVGATSPFQHRHRLTVEQFGWAAYHFLLENHFIPAHLQPNFAHTTKSILQHIEMIFKSAEPIKFIRLHGDCHIGNILWRDSGPHVVDLDDCMMGPAIQDLWMLLSGDVTQRAIQIEHILRGYQEFHDFNYSELHLIEALRSLRMLHYSAWLAKRWEDPAFQLNFPWFNTVYYWQEQLNHLNEQLSLLLDPI